MTIGDLAKRFERGLKDNSQEVLTALGITGVLSTSYLVGKASYDAGVIIYRTESKEGAAADPRQRFKERTKQVWKLYIPAVTSGALTITCIVLGPRIGAKKTAAAYSLLTVSEKAFTEYREKVAEQLGERKEKAIRDEIAQDHVTRGQTVIIGGNGQVLCYEMHTGRYFNCDMETLRRAQNDINAKMIREVEATLSDFYYMVGLPYTTHSNGTGWDSDKMLELSFSTVMSEDNRPCIAFEYNYVKPL